METMQSTSEGEINVIESRQEAKSQDCHEFIKPIVEVSGLSSEDLVCDKDVEMSEDWRQVKTESQDKINTETNQEIEITEAGTEKQTVSTDAAGTKIREDLTETDQAAASTSSDYGIRCPMSSSYQDANECHVIDDTDDEDSDLDRDDSDYEVPNEEVERWLEEALENRKRTAEQANLNGLPYEEKHKVVLVEKDKNHFEVLPEGWMEVTHNSGMPVYLHKQTRVCTLSRPYFLGPGSARKHEIPLGSVPCLNYKKMLEKEEEEAKAKKARDSEAATPLEFPFVKIQTVQETKESHNLKPDQLKAYCEKLFQFRTVKVVRFNSWSARRQYNKRQKQEKHLQRPMLPDGTKLITFPILADPGNNGPPYAKKEWIMNPNGKSYVCILHEYVQHALRKQPSYNFTELENAATPYGATVVIDGMQYGIGYGTSKKQAKSEAAKVTLEILIPEMRQKIAKDDKNANDDTYDTTFFDEIKVEDPRVAELCAKTTEPSPHDILLTCLQRNFGVEQLQVSYHGSTGRNQMNEFTMTVGKHSATVVCRNKREGKQRASQAILQALHPHVESWGSLLRLYGNRSVKRFKDQKREEQEITLLQSKAAVNSPNFAILNKLKTELRKLGDKRKAMWATYDGVNIPPGLMMINLARLHQR